MKKSIEAKLRVETDEPKWEVHIKVSSKWTGNLARIYEITFIG